MDYVLVFRNEKLSVHRIQKLEFYLSNLCFSDIFSMLFTMNPAMVPTLIPKRRPGKTLSSYIKFAPLPIMAE